MGIPTGNNAHYPTVVPPLQPLAGLLAGLPFLRFALRRNIPFLYSP